MTLQKPEFNLMVEIDKLADQFEKEWRSNEKPIIENYVQNFESKEFVERLQASLIRLELELRCSDGEEIRSIENEYFERFPDFAGELIAELKHEALGETAAGETPPLSNVHRTREPSSSTAPLPRDFGGYELIEEIAHGGMGIVYKARQKNINRVCALKLIISGKFAGEDAIQRFYREAEAAANLEHPGIVPIFEVGESEGQTFYSMSLIKGTNLDQRMGGNPLPPRVAATFVKKISEAVAYAHQHYVIHRDLKPSNILIDEFDQPKIADFGLAKNIKGESELTATGQIIGTPSYMPPEQAMGKLDAVDERSDVYSIGTILYKLLAGRPPFQAATPMDTIKQVIDREPIPPTKLTPKIPRDLETVCLKCLQKEPVRRYQSSAELAEDLDRWLHHKPIKARKINRIEKTYYWCRRNPRSVGVLAISVIMLLIVVAIFIETRANSIVQNLTDADPANVRDVASRISPLSFRVDPKLVRVCENSESKTQSINAQIGLVQRHPSYALSLQDTFSDPSIDIEYTKLVCDTLKDLNIAPAVELRNIFRNGSKDPSVRLRVGLALAYLESANELDWKKQDFDRLLQLFLDAKYSTREKAFALNLMQPKAEDLDDSVFEFFTNSTDRLFRIETLNIATALFANDSIKLMRFLQDANSEELGLLLPLLKENPIEVAESLGRYSARPMFTTNQSVVNSFDDASAQVRDLIDVFEGIYHEEFVICSKISVTEFENLVDKLNSYGFRPASYRPYAFDQEVSGTAIWLRDGKAVKVFVDLTKDQVNELIEQSKNNFRLVDLSGVKKSIDLPLLYCGIFVACDPEDDQERKQYFELDFQKVINQFAKNPSERLLRFSGDAGTNPRTYTAMTVAPTADEYVYPLIPRFLLEKLPYCDYYSVNDASSSNDQLKGFFCVDNQNRFETIVDESQSMDFIGKVITERMNKGFVPYSMVHCEHSHSRFDLIWRRNRIDQSTMDKAASAKTNNAILMAALGETSPLLEILKYSRQPRSRTYGIHRLSQGFPPTKLIEWLDEAKDVGIRQAILLGLCEFDELPTLFDSKIRSKIEKIFVQDPHPGIHVAAKLVLLKIQNGSGQSKESIADFESANKLPPIEPREWDKSILESDQPAWITNSIGQTMSVVKPAKFLYGSTSNDPHNERGLEKIWLAQGVNYHFAISCNEVTMSQFLKFDPKHQRKIDKNWQGRNQSTPVGRVSWVDAVRFCNWLSEQEGLKKCYPDDLSKDDIASDYLMRPGYRLPTRAEWEYCCRAGSTSPRFYGFDESLLPKYAWCAFNSDFKAQPVGLVFPNFWGLQGMYGNASEWCFDVVKKGTKNNNGFKLTDSPRFLRGGTAGWGGRQARSGFINSGDPTVPSESVSSHIGFRVVRTIVQEN